MPARQNWLEGWRLFAVLTLILICLSIWIAGMRQFEVDGVRMVIRFTARTSLLFFCLAFSLPRRWRNSAPTPGRAGSAATAAISASPSRLRTASMHWRSWPSRRMDPAAFAGATSAASYVFGGIGYAFIVAMTATSFDRSATGIGPRAFRALHLTGGYYILLQFTVSFGKRSPGHAALRAVFDSAGRGVCAAHDRDGHNIGPAHGSSRLTAPVPCRGFKPTGTAGAIIQFDPIAIRQHRGHEVAHWVRRDLVAHFWIGCRQRLEDRLGDLSGGNPVAPSCSMKARMCSRAGKYGELL